jgi:UDP-N-acetylmuramoylalanine--D-glutamate ligase
MFDENTRFGILGLARSGIAAAYKLKELGFSPFLSEFRTAEHIPEADRLNKDFECEFGEHTDRILSCTDVIVSPGIPLDIPILKKIKKNKIEIMSEIELGFLIKDASSKIIAITGSNGKSTTVSLIYDILKKSGYRTILAGNIGDAFTSFPIEKPGLDFIVLELSSFQLDLIKTFRADVAAILNLTPDHLNRYDSFEDYAHAKFQIYANQTSSDYAIINLDDEIVNNFKDRIFVNKLHFSLKKNGLSDIIFDGRKIIFENLKLKVKQLPIKGPHNIANIMAAILAVSPFSVQAEDMKAAIEGFKGLEHRLEFVASVKNVKFYNDSKATNTESVKLALLSFKKPVRIIMGGAGKGEDYSVLNPYLKRTAKKVYLLGEAKFEMAETFKNITEIEIFSDFRSAVEKSFADAHKGDTVLLSPACTSYDMFNNFEERGNFFKQIVRELADGK